MPHYPVKCGEPGCSQVFGTGRQRRRHVHSVHRTLTDICANCNNEPFMTNAAKQQHIGDGHIKALYRRNHHDLDSLPNFSTLTITSDLFDVSSESALNILIAQFVQPDEDFLRTRMSAVDDLVTLFQHNAPEHLRPSRVIKGGSLCKGTSVKGKSDIDLYVMLVNYDTVYDLVHDMHTKLRQVEEYLKMRPNIVVTPNTTSRCVQIKITKGGETIEADVLPAVDLLARKTPTEVYQQMVGKTDQMKSYYGPCLAPLQKKLYEEIPTKVKSLIRLLKYWKKEKLKAADRRTRLPVSYALELVVLYSWTIAEDPESFNMVQGLHAVLTNLVNHDDFRIIFPERRRFYSKAFLDYEKKTPYIMDPVNPFNNLYCMNNVDFDWAETARKAEEWLQKPLFYRVSSSPTNWG